MNFNEAADLQDAQYVAPKQFPNALFSFLTHWDMQIDTTVQSDT